MKLSKRLLILFIIMAIIAVLLITVIVSGLFPYQNRVTPKPNQDGPAVHNTSDSIPEAVKYQHISRLIHGSKQEINLMEIDVKNPSVVIAPVLSHDLVYGFESLSSIVKRSNSYAAVNAGFFSPYGIPAGLVVINGEVITASRPVYPVFSCSSGKAAISDVKTGIWIYFGDKKIKINSVNIPAGPKGITLFTKYFGSNNRAETKNRSITVKKGLVIDNSFYQGQAGIPEDGFLITDYSGNSDLEGLKNGETVKILYTPGLAQMDYAYECGSWIVKDSKIVIGPSDPWIGVTTNKDPRTAIGLKDENTVALLTVDGRQPGYSAGLTGRELGELLLEFGVTDAAMLDGGASTEMIVKGEIVNRPSFQGQERPLGGAITVRYNK